MATVAVGERAPALELTGLDGRTYNLEDVGQPVLAFFFKVSCETCAFTFPYLHPL